MTTDRLESRSVDKWTGFSELYSGLTPGNKARLAERSNGLLLQYYDRICEAVTAAGNDFVIPKPESLG